MKKIFPMLPSPWPASEMNLFLEHYFYSPEAFLITEILAAHPESGEIFARCQPQNRWVFAPFQRGSEKKHPRHISGGDLVMLTASLGSLHAYFFQNCKWQEGWVGFGSRMERVDFHSLARLDLPLELHSKEVKVRKGSKRTLMTFDFRFSQENKLVYSSQQTALFVKSESLS